MPRWLVISVGPDAQSALSNRVPTSRHALWRGARRISLSSQNEPLKNETDVSVAPSSTTRITRRSAELNTKKPVAAQARPKLRPVRALAIFGAVAGLVASVALPAYAAFKPVADEAITLQQVAENGAQTLVVASDADTANLEATTYAATTVAEIEQKKAEAAAAERAKELAAQAAAAAAAVSTEESSSDSWSNMDFSMVPAGSGAVIFPLQSYDYIGDGFRSRGGSHDGVDILAPAMTPIYAVADGVVTVSSESYWGYGVGVVIDHVIGGQRVTSLYGHMTYGTRMVSVGESVAVGQPIGAVGTTGRSTANHLHFEIEINGSLVDPMAWLNANMG